MDQRTESLLRQFLQSLDCEFVGLQSHKLLLANDRKTKSTYAFQLENLTAEKIQKHIEDKRKEFLCWKN